MQMGETSARRNGSELLQTTCCKRELLDKVKVRIQCAMISDPRRSARSSQEVFQARYTTHSASKLSARAFSVTLTFNARVVMGVDLPPTVLG